MAQYTYSTYTPCTTPDLFNEMAKGESTWELLMNPYVYVGEKLICYLCVWEKHTVYLAKMISNKKASTQMFANSAS